MQILIGACGQAAKYGTVASPYRFYSEWKVPHPFSLDELQKKYIEKLGRISPTPQDVLLYSLLCPANFLDIIRNFITFKIESGKSVKKIARYQQVIAGYFFN